jgi:nicotinamide/nicotinate riboside kinase
VYPAYLEAHRELFEGGDVHHGQPTGDKVENLVLIETLEMSMGDMVELCCKNLLKEAKVKGGREDG